MTESHAKMAWPMLSKEMIFTMGLPLTLIMMGGGMALRNNKNTKKVVRSYLPPPPIFICKDLPQPFKG